MITEKISYDKIPYGEQALFEEDGKWVAIDNRDGNAWTENFDTKNEAIEYLNGEYADPISHAKETKDAGRKYDDLTTEEKADFIAYLLSRGIFEYLDSCSKEEDGNYHYYCSEEDKTYTYTPEELVNNLEAEIGKDTIEEYWEE